MHQTTTLNCEKEQERQASQLEINLLGRLRGHNDPLFVKLGERLEKLRQDYEAGVIKAIDWLKGLLDTVKDAVQAEKNTKETPITEDDNKEALTKLFIETRPEKTPDIIRQIVEQIDAIVNVTRFDGWQNSVNGPREVQKALIVTLNKFGLSNDKTSFQKVYDYIQEHY